MSKGLEALHILENELLDTGYTSEERNEALDLLYKELKRLEEIDNGAYVPVHINIYNELCDKEKALEIIKKKKVDIKYLCYRAEFNIEKYNDNYIETLTQEECDLLKEVLL